MTHVEALDLARLPEHLIVLGGGYVGLELSQAFRRFGSRVTVIERGPQLASREDPDISNALKDLFVDEGIEVLLKINVSQVEGLRTSCEPRNLRRRRPPSLKYFDAANSGRAPLADVMDREESKEGFIGSSSAATPFPGQNSDRND